MQVDSSLVTYAYEASSYNGYHNPNIVCIHDVECPIKNGYARSLIGPAWFGGPAKTSTHYLVGPDDICQGVPENRIAWHCGNGNPRSIAIEQCGYASYSATDWDTSEGLVQQENVSKLLADINQRKPLIRLRTLSDSELRNAWNNPGTPGGITTHDQMRRVFGGTTHYDPWNAPNVGVAYPLQRVIDRAVQIRGGNIDPPKPIEDEDEDMYHTYQPTEGPDTGAIWIACPGFFEPLPSMEYYNALVLSGAARSVKAVSHREFDVIRDSYRRFGPLQAPTTSRVTNTATTFGDAILWADKNGFDAASKPVLTAQEVWEHPVPSFVSNDHQRADNMLGWTNKAAEQAVVNTTPAPKD